MNLPHFMQPSLQRPCTPRAPALHAIVQIACRQRGTPGVWLAHSRSRDPGGQAKTEGKIKGPARACPQSQSARGVGTARRLVACVPPDSANPEGTGPGRVPSSMRYAAPRWSLCHGHA